MATIDNLGEGCKRRFILIPLVANQVQGPLIYGPRRFVLGS